MRYDAGLVAAFATVFIVLMTLVVVKYVLFSGGLG